MPADRQRTSLLAISSLVVSLVCCIPTLGAVGMLLGGSALISIRMSSGRKRGTGLAVGGIVIGLIVTVVWGALLVGAVMMVNSSAGLARALPAAQSHDTAGVQAQFASTVTVTPEQVIAFGDALTDAHGRYLSTPTGVLEYIQARARVPSGEKLAAVAAQLFPGTQQFLVPSEFDKGTVAVFMVIETGGGGVSGSAGAPGPMMLLRNLGFDDARGGLVWLIPPPLPAPAASPATAAPAPQLPPPTNPAPP